MNHAERAIVAAKGILAELAELEAQFPWLVERADRDGIYDYTLPSLDDLDAEIYERYVNIRVSASLASETLRAWEVSI
jgi:hypothetical protein